jgi:hypothetical protein
MLYDARPAGIDACFFRLLFYVVFDWVLGNHSHLYTFVKTSLSLSLLFFSYYKSIYLYS